MKIKHLLLGFVLISMFIIAAGFASANTLGIENEVYYSFDETYANDTIGGTPIGAAGILDGVIDFDGSTDFITIADDTSISFTENDDFTITMWVKGTYDGSISEIFTKRLTNDRYNIQLDGSNQLQAQIGDGSNVQSITDNVSFNDGNWHFIALTYNGTSYLYKDTNLIGSDNTALSGLSTTGADAFIGKGTNGFFDGYIDEVSVWSRSLTTSELSDLYQSGTPTQRTDVIDSTNLEYYNSMDFLYDFSGTGTHATVTSASLNTEGVLNSKFVFDGSNDKIDFTSSDTVFTATSDFTISFWAKSSDTTSEFLFSTSPTSDYSTDYIYMGYLGGVGDFAVLMEGNGGTANVQLNGDGSINDGTWKHIVIVHDGANSNAYLYVNGTEMVNHTGFTSSGTYNTHGGWSLGTANNRENAADFLTGEMDEFSIWSRALSSSEVSELYNSETGLNPYDDTTYYQTEEDNRALSGNDDTVANSDNNDYGLAGEFSTTSAYDVGAIDVELAIAAGSPTGDVKLYIYNDSGGSGPDTLLYTSDTTLDISTVTSTYTPYTFYFPSSSSLEASTTYWFVIKKTDNSFDATNNIKINGLLNGAATGLTTYRSPSDGTWNSWSANWGYSNRIYSVTETAAAAGLNNYTTISSASYKNEIPVSISTAWATVNTVVVTNNNNNTPYYTTASLTTNATSSNSNAACRIQYDGVTQKSVTRSLSSGTLGNLYLLTGKTNQTVGNFTVTVQCQKTSGGNYQIADSELSILHVYDTTTNTTIDYVTINDTGYGVNTTDTLLNSFSFTTGNVTNTTNIASVVVHGRATYDYSATNNITSYLKIQETGETCGNYTRYGATGTTGSVGALCVFKDLNSSTTYNFSLYGFTDSGTGGIDDLFMNVYNLETNDTAVATTDLSYSVPNNTETTVATINITNPLGGSYNVFTSASIMVTGNASEDAYFYIDDGTSSVKFYRTLDTEGNANIKAQNTFSDSGTATKTYSLKAYCPSGCEVTAGDFEAFVTDAQTASTGTFTITAYNFYNNTQLNTFNATVLGAIYTTTTGSITALGTGTLSVLVEAENFFSNTSSHDTTTSLNASLTKYTEIRANEYLGSAITNFTLNSSVGNYTTTNGVAYLPITSNISVTINGDDIAQTSEYINQTQFYNFTVYAYNSIFIEFRDSTTEALVNNVTLEYFSDSDSGTNSTTTGTLYLTLLQPESYIFTYNATGYDTNNYFLTITNDTYSNITMWLNPASNTTAITVIILDGSASPLENAIVSAQKHFISDNTYKTVAMGTTNPEGETVMDLVTANEFYKFTVVYNGETVKITNPFIITGTTIKIQVFIGEVALEDFYSWEGIVSSLTFNEATDNFRFTFSDGASNNYQYCLYTYRRNPASDTLLDTSCSTGNSGTILYGVSNVSGRTYYSTATVSIGGTEYPLGSYTYTYGSGDVGSAGLLPQMLLTIVMALAGFLLPELLFITVPLSILIGGLIGLHAIPMIFTTPLLVVGIILMIMMRRTSGGL